MAQQFLDYEVALLLVKYGKSAVLSSLSRKLAISLSDLEASLEHLPVGKAPPPNLARDRNACDRNPCERLEELCERYPKKATHLRELREQFERRRFLPELRDVRRFFHRHGGQPPSVKSRADCLPQVLQRLAEMTVSELGELHRLLSTGEYSSLGIIAEEILRKHA